ncbi:MAG: sn-glycerol-3-phosphate ABC transporter ATP-binding protein UgpC [Solirubrobacteraceae bacterium]|jgi:multiple sugar transport system ATP-binding protein
MAAISLEKVTKVYPNGYEAVHELDLDVADGEFMVLVGPSGCGKTTALRMVAGLEDITGGSVRIGDRVVNDVSPKDRDIAMVFQNYALYPHMTVRRNIGFGLRLRKVPKEEIDRKVTEAAELLGLTEWIDRKPGQLSGGQRQRVAMGRAIVREPSVFLMDEPLSNLDAKLRVQMRAEVARIQQRLGVATLYVTHDQIEAMTMGDRVAVISGGVLQQCASPQEVYDSPSNLFVAGFMGSPAMNLFEATVDERAGSVLIGSQRIGLPTELHATRTALRGYAGRSVVTGIRPEDLALIRPDELPAGSDSEIFEAHVDLVEALGSEMLVHFTSDARPVEVGGTKDEEDAEGLSEGTLVRAGGVARVEARTRLAAGSAAYFRLNPTRLHFFDTETGKAIAN